MKYTDYLIERIKLEGVNNYRVLLKLVFIIDFLGEESKKMQSMVSNNDVSLGKTLEYNPYTTDNQILYNIIKDSLYLSLYKYLKNKGMEHLIYEVEFKKEDFDGIIMFIKDSEYTFISLEDFLTTFDITWNNRKIKNDGLHHEVKLKRVRK